MTPLATLRARYHVILDLRVNMFLGARDPLWNILRCAEDVVLMQMAEAMDREKAERAGEKVG
jgi:hypothetical protein